MTGDGDSWADNGEIRLWWQRFSGPGGGIPLLLINGLGSPSVAYQHGFADLVAQVTQFID
jgi:hypothetical protein